MRRYNVKGLVSEWCRCGAKSKFGWMGVYLAYIPIQTNELGAADAPLSRQAPREFLFDYTLNF